MDKLEQMVIYLIGIGNKKNPSFSPEVEALVKAGYYYSGGTRHYELVQDLLPAKHHWIPIKGKMENLVQKYRSLNASILIFVSGDPFFYGFGNTLKRLMPTTCLKAYPTFNCLQLLCHKKQVAYNELLAVSLHGRPWKKLDEVLRSDQSLIGILTDAQHSPAHIAQRMLRYGVDNYKMLVGENLGGDDEQISTLELKEASNYKAASLNCVLLIRTQSRKLALSQPDNTFKTLAGRPKMITKMPLRLLNVQLLELHKANTFWDIGSCTGAIAIDAKRHYPHLEVLAIEKRLECGAIIQQNCEQQQTSGIEVLIHDFFDLDLATFPTPQSVFIGGHGGRLETLIKQLDAYLIEGATVVMNTVLESSLNTFLATFGHLNYSLSDKMKLVIDDHNTIHVLVAKKNK
ncbi:precorrin-6y C5,15-methyltransferase (decarboxylating) subunit CbiE [Aureispira anguillae]|uniref:Precorrin-6y C5,15-methyltransferase (Decarboxylating) subunit CbiE n=1 Tax=Aureispira anguillae TaxID=2864201 RepID=A0A916DSP7_9BACT|nr:precorrin-6y C5,15-methyltransferase (decarboxylating) subunit CbiE [Aureispira anguillae]BDS11202.1 precorrin-6y C5,15-methyltransferase (decarboxylating) subunit CbiE [Aureispira anguillae]